MSDDIEIKIINSDEFADKLKEYLKEKPEFKPVLLTVEDPNAIFVEFGTRPAQHTSTGSGKKSQAYLRIKYWVEHKSGLRGKNRMETEAIAFRIYKDIMQKGMIPQPFFRPAVHAMEAELALGNSRVKGLLPIQIAEVLRDDMIDILRTHNTPFETTIDSSISIEVIEDEGGIPITREIVPQDIMDSDKLNIEGKDRSSERKWRR